MQKVLCDKHPLQKMDRINFSRDGKVEFDGFKCPQCQRRYVLGENWGYTDYVPGEEVRPNPDPQMRCPLHQMPLYLAGFEFNGNQSVREWRCPYECGETKTTVGENHLDVLI